MCLSRWPPPPAAQEFEIDFISLSYCNSASDVFECRALLDSLNMLQTKIIAKVGAHVLAHWSCCCCVHRVEGRGCLTTGKLSFGQTVRQGRC